MKDTTASGLLNIVLMAMLMCVGAIMYSQHPVVSSSRSHGPQKDKPRADYRATDDINRDTPALKAANPEEVTNANQRDADEWTKDWGMFWLTLGLLICAAIQAWFFYSQLGIMSDNVRDTKAAAEAATEAVNVARDNAKREMRAYVSIELAPDDIRISSQNPLGFRFRLFNHGRTPAMELGYRAYAKCVSVPLGEDLPQLDKIEGRWNEKRMTVFPSKASDQVSKMNCNLGWVMTPQQLNEISRGQTGILFGIEIQYLDIFSENPNFTQEFFLFTMAGLMTVPGGSRAT